MERQLKIKLMELDIECRLQEIRMESRKFTVRLVLALAAAFAAGGGLTVAVAAVLRLVLYHQELK